MIWKQGPKPVQSVVSNSNWEHALPFVDLNIQVNKGNERQRVSGERNGKEPTVHSQFSKPWLIVLSKQSHWMTDMQAGTATSQTSSLDRIIHYTLSWLWATVPEWEWWLGLGFRNLDIPRNQPAWENKGQVHFPHKRARTKVKEQQTESDTFKMSEDQGDSVLR